jgi:hypothetical protein
MKDTSTDFQRLCDESLARYFAKYPNAATAARGMKAMRFIMAGERPLSGKPEGWAAGIVYFLATQNHQACGVPGVLNSEFEAFFGVSMGTVRKRAARVGQLITV